MKKVFVVDDDQEVVGLYTRLIRMKYRNAVEVVAADIFSLDTVLQDFTASVADIALVLCDGNINSAVRGVEVVKALAPSGVRIVAATSDSGIATNMIRAGAVCHLSKPLSFEHFFRVCQESGL